MSKDRHHLIPAVYIILRRADEVLLIRRFQTGWRDGEYCVPAGHLDGGESALKAAIREAKEEVGVDIQAADLKLVSVIHRMAEERDHERLDLFFEASNWQGQPFNAEPHKSDDLRWAKVDDLPDKTIPVVRQALQSAASQQLFTEMDF